MRTASGRELSRLFLKTKGRPPRNPLGGKVLFLLWYSPRFLPPPWLWNELGMIRAVIFDFNGVLVDDEHVHFELFREVLAEEGVAISEQQYHEQLPRLRRPRLFRGRPARRRPRGRRAAARRSDCAQGAALRRGRRGRLAFLSRRGQLPDRAGRMLAAGDQLGCTPARDRVRPRSARLPRPGRGHRLGRGHDPLQARSPGLPAGPRALRRHPGDGPRWPIFAPSNAWSSRTAWPAWPRPRGPGCGRSASPTPTGPRRCGRPGPMRSSTAWRR